MAAKMKARNIPAWFWILTIGYVLGCLIFMKACIGSELKAVQLKDGMTCYDEKSFKQIDDQLKAGIDCRVKLQNQKEPVSPRWFQSTPSKIIIGVILGIGLGLGIGATY